MRYQIRSSTCNFDVDEKDRSLMIHFSFFVERQRERERAGGRNNIVINKYGKETKRIISFFEASNK